MSRSAVDLGQVRANLHHLPLHAWSCRSDGHCDYLSRRWVDYTGVPEADHHGRGWLDAVHPDDRTRDGWDAFVAGAGEYDVNYRLRRHDGAYRWFKTRGSLARAADGAPLRVLGTTTDIDDQQRAEGDFARKDGRFVAGMTIHVAEPREWSPQVVALVEETAERTSPKW